MVGRASDEAERTAGETAALWAGVAVLSLGCASRLRLSLVMPAAAAGVELALPLLLRVPLPGVVVLLSFERVGLRARIFAAPPFAVGSKDGQPTRGRGCGRQ